MEDRKGRWHLGYNFNDMFVEGVNYFESIFKAKRRTTIAKILIFPNMFPRFVSRRQSTIDGGSGKRGITFYTTNVLER
jgi:hypothetical protein